MVDGVPDPQVRKTQRGNIVVELECTESRRVGLECENQDITHQSHVLVDILRESILRGQTFGLPVDIAQIRSAV